MSSDQVHAKKKKNTHTLKHTKKPIIFYNLHKRSMRPTQASGVMTTVFTTHNPSMASDNNSNTAGYINML